MKCILISYADNWADELDVSWYEAIRFTEEGYADFQEKCRRIAHSRRGVTVSIGSNEWIDYETGAEFIDALDIRDITEDQLNFLHEIGIGTDSISWRIDNAYDEIIENGDEEEDWDEDEEDEEDWEDEEDE